MSTDSKQRSEEFLRISDQFRLGGLTTEASHPVTSNLSEIAKADIAEALNLLLQVDDDVIRTYRAFAETGRAAKIAATVVSALENGGKLFFTGCGSTGRLSIQLVSIWRHFWQQHAARAAQSTPRFAELEQRAMAVMAGGDYALIKAVEGFEDFSAFGKKQIGDLGLGSEDVVFAITEGGETSFVIGTAWQGVAAGAKVYFVYNNPDMVLCQTVRRSREIIEDPRVEKLNLTTGPMAITGSTRMQATTIQLCVLLTILEIVVREFMKKLDPNGPCALDSSKVPANFLRALLELYSTLRSAPVRAALAKLVTLEEATYRAGRKNNYFADLLAIDVLTDTTERSPTYCTPPFRKFDDHKATESWAFLFSPPEETSRAWEHIIRRTPACIAWTEAEVRELVPPEKVAGTCETVNRISHRELMRFKVGLDGVRYRPVGKGDMCVAVVSEPERASLFEPTGFHRTQMECAHNAGAQIGLIYIGGVGSISEVSKFLESWGVRCHAVLMPVPETDLLLGGLTRVAIKVLLNTLSTCTMVRLGRVMGNYMVWVVPSNLKLIDRATRYIQNLTNLPYREANHLLFEVIEYVAPRMKADQAYPPVVGLSVLRARHGFSNEQAEQRLREELA